MHMQALPIDCLVPNAAVGYAIGRDHARYGIAPPASLLFQGSALREGFSAARLRFAGRCMRPSTAARQWLALRTAAWLSGSGFEEHQLTPNHLRQLQVSHCPVSRLPLAVSNLPSRLLPEAAYASGHMAQLHPMVAALVPGTSWQQANATAESLRMGEQAQGLDANAWRRLAALLSFVTPLSGTEAAAQPLCVLPPNRLRLLNAAQGVQVLLTKLLAQPGWTPVLRRWAGLLGDPQAIQALHMLAMALAARLLPNRHLQEPMARRHAMEDAWLCSRVQRAWAQWAALLSTEQLHALCADAAQSPRAGAVVVHTSHVQATEGWSLDGSTPRPTAALWPMPTAKKRLGRRLGEPHVASSSLFEGHDHLVAQSA